MPSIRPPYSVLVRIVVLSRRAGLSAGTGGGQRDHRLGCEGGYSTVPNAH